MDPIERRFMHLRRLAGVCAALLLAVTSLSAFQRLTYAGLGCADWPQCYGQNLHAPAHDSAVASGVADPASSPVVWLAHRVLATVVLLLIGAIVIVSLGSPPLLRSEGWVGLVLLGLALFLAVLSRWGSGARAPAVALGNLLGSVAMLALCTRLAVAGLQTESLRLRVWVGAAALIMLAQVALGGMVSASYAGLSCRGWAECVAAAQSVGWETLNPWREPHLSASPPVNPEGALVHLLHRGLGLALVVLVLPLAAFALRRGRPNSAAALLIFLVAQVAVGLMMSVEDLHLQFAVLHNLLAAALLATLVLLF